MRSLEMKGSSVCCWNRPGLEKEMLFLMSAGLTLMPARRNGKERASMVSAAFYGAWGDLDEMYNFKTPTAKPIPTLNNSLKFFLLPVLCLHSVWMSYSSIWPIVIRCYHSKPEWTWERWQWRDTPHSPKCLYYWNLTIKLLCVIPRTLVREGSCPYAEIQSVYFIAEANWAKKFGLLSLETRLLPRQKSFPGSKFTDFRRKFKNIM